MKIRVLTESGCGLTKQEANDLGIDFLPLQVQIEDKTYLDGVDLTVEEPVFRGLHHECLEAILRKS